jgi:glycosyltransferase involved in cell wall biosynthesis
MGRRVCLVAPLCPRTGNFTTASRILSFFDEGDAVAISHDEPSPVEEHFRLCLILHAHRAGLYVWPTEFSPCTIKADRYVVIFGGTDVNVLSQNPAALAQMQFVLDKVEAVVCFSQVFADQARCVFKRLPRVVVIRQSVCLPVPQMVGGATSPEPLSGILAACGRGQDTRVALLPGGIRSVKGQKYAVEAWTTVSSKILLLLVGPVLDMAYLAALDLSRHPNVVLSPGVECCQMSSLMGDSRVVCVLNTSESEGQPQAVLEAMLLRKPVVVRDIPANLDLVDSARGIVFSSPAHLAAIMNSWEAPSHELLDCAWRFVSEHHSVALERAMYRELGGQS